MKACLILLSLLTVHFAYAQEQTNSSERLRVISEIDEMGLGLSNYDIDNLVEFSANRCVEKLQTYSVSASLYLVVRHHLNANAYFGMQTGVLENSFGFELIFDLPNDYVLENCSVQLFRDGGYRVSYF